MFNHLCGVHNIWVCGFDMLSQMNELYVEIDRNGLQQEIPSAEMPTTVHLADSTAVGPHLMVGAIEAQESCPANDSMDEANAKMLVPDNEVQSPENNVNNDSQTVGGRCRRQCLSPFP